MTEEFKYSAFISYSHVDEPLATWLHRRLERYRVPAHLVGRQTNRGMVPRTIGRCFRDQVELSAANNLSETLQQALKDSRALIVVCSPQSAQSQWVNEEIRYFRALGKGGDIYALIVSGEPNSPDPAQRCFPLALLQDEHGHLLQEPLAADARPGHDGRSDAFLKLASGLLGLGFDELRRREQRRRTQLMAIAIAASFSVALLTSLLAVSAYHARNEAQQRRDQANDLISFMLGDLKAGLEKVGRLDVLDSTVAKAMTYLGASKLDETNPGVLADRSRAFASISEIRYARGQLLEAIAAARNSVSAAQALRMTRPGDEADQLLAHAFRTLGEPSLEKGEFDATVQGTATALDLARRLHATHPDNGEWSYLLAIADDQMGYIEAYGPKSDHEKGEALWQDCIDVLRPLVGAKEADSKFTTFMLRCELQKATVLDRRKAAPLAWRQLVADAAIAEARYPRDMALASILLTGLGVAANGLLTAGQLAEAQASSNAVLELGRRMVAFDPTNNDWLHWLASAAFTDSSINEQAGDLPRARNAADEALKLLEESMRRDPTSVNLRAEMMNLRRMRGMLNGREPAGEMSALRELDAGVALLKADERQTDTDFLLYAARLQADRWYWLRKLDSESAQSALTEAHQLAGRLSDASYAKYVDALNAELAYADGDIATGDQRLLALQADASPKNLAHLGLFRALACRHSTRACPKLAQSFPDSNKPANN